MATIRPLLPPPQDVNKEDWRAINAWIDAVLLGLPTLGLKTIEELGGEYGQSEMVAPSFPLLPPPVPLPSLIFHYLRMTVMPSTPFRLPPPSAGARAFSPSPYPIICR